VTQVRARSLLITLASLAALIGAACLDRPAGRPDRGRAPGATSVSFRTPDGLTLNGRLWARDPKRVVIYLHEYRGSQTTWWPAAEEGTAGDPSALTLDFRGHGTSDGSAEDIAGVALDAEAAIAFARDRGYDRAVIVGSGMGATAGIIAAADEARVAVLGLSAPSEFSELRADAAIASLAPRVALMASEGDLSARESIADFRARAAIPASRVVVVQGIDHGEALLRGEQGRQAMTAFRRLLSELWQS
jgi:pimeloyl-ACP methyl ester carboxylesterase